MWLTASQFLNNTNYDISALFFFILFIYLFILFLFFYPLSIPLVGLMKALDGWPPPVSNPGQIFKVTPRFI